MAGTFSLSEPTIDPPKPAQIRGGGVWEIGSKGRAVKFPIMMCSRDGSNLCVTSGVGVEVGVGGSES